MLGQGLVPKGYDPRVAGIEPGALARRAAALRAEVAAAARATPDHADYIRQSPAAAGLAA